MVFSSSTFLLLFLPIVIIVYYNPFLKSRGFRNVFILLSSLFFYAWGEPIFVFVMLFSILVSWIIGVYLGKSHNKILLTIGTVYHISILFIFKYLTFFASQVGLLLHKDTSSINITLPIGISFFTFQLMSYLFDIYYGKAGAQRNPLNIALYISLFPQLIAGPIVRYETIENDILNRKESLDLFCLGVKRFIYGLAKKVLIADYMAQIADTIFNTHMKLSFLTVWLGAIAYTMQIYFDFSGYSDMAIGLGSMFGFSFPENFNYPYISKSITEFWRRWHISLSTWFRDYVYIPMGGNRVSKKRWVINLFTVWALTGIWHGANWTFICWGLLYFVFLMIEKQFAIVDKLGVFSRIYTGIVVIVLWVIFRSESMGFAINYIGKMFGIGLKGGFVDGLFIDKIFGTSVLLIVSVIGMTPLFNKVMNQINNKNLHWIESSWVVIILLLSIISIVASTYSPFIYFNF